MSTLHILFSPKAEGCPRLALDLIDQEAAQTGKQSSVAFLVSEPDELLNEFHSKCQSIHHFNWRPRAFAGLFFSVLQLLRRERPDGIICYTLGHHVPISMAATVTGVPIVVHIGNAPPIDVRDRRKLKAVMKAGSPFVRMHIACSDAIASDCRETYRLKRVRSVPNGIDIPRFTALRHHSKARSRAAKLFGMVASLASHKDQAILIEAMSILKKRGTSDRLVLAGAGSELERLQALAEQLEIGDRIDWLGNVSDVRTVLADLDFFVFATTPSEGLGIALVEAMAAGVPVVASDVPACREVLEGGRWGRLVPGRDAEVWADALTDEALIPIPSEDVLNRYDVRETWRAYAEALGLP